MTIISAVYLFVAIVALDVRDRHAPLRARA
jgi:hypothetical protein